MDNRQLLQMSRSMLEAYERACKPVCAELKIPQQAFDILLFLANNPEYFTAKDITQIRGIKPNMVSFHVDKLVKAGLLSREEIPGDRRQVKLLCTEKAAPIIERGRNAQKQFFARLSAGFLPSELAQGMEYLTRLEENIDAMLQEKTTEGH